MDNQNIKDTILSRLQRNSDFPAMSKTVNLLNKFKSSEDASISEFANIILKDYALTTRILKLVNSVNYAQFGEVTTISRAIILLGLENIKNIAVTLVLFDHLQKHSSNSELMNTIVSSFYSALIAQKISQDINFGDKEEAFICSLFHTFGRLMVAFSIPEKIDEIKHFSQEKGISEDLAAHSVLGTSYEGIGMSLAKEWNFPSKIIQCMPDFSISEIIPKPSEMDKLRSLSTFSNKISRIMTMYPDKKERSERIDKLIKSFKDHFGVIGNKIVDIIDASIQDLVEFSNVFNLNLNNVPFSRQLLGLPKDREPWSDKDLAKFDFTTDSLKTIDSIIENEKADTPESIFTKGIQDVNSAIMSNFSLNDIIRIVLETMYRGMQLSGLSNVLFFIKDTKLPVMSIRFGFGGSIEEIKKWFKIGFENTDNIFAVAVLKQKDLVIKDITASDIKGLLPDWYRNRVPYQAFIILLPIIINTKPIGMFYIEGDKGGFQTVSSGQLNYLKILRDQTVMAIKQIQGY